MIVMRDSSGVKIMDIATKHLTNLLHLLLLRPPILRPREFLLNDIHEPSFLKLLLVLLRTINWPPNRPRPIKNETSPFLER